MSLKRVRSLPLLSSTKDPSTSPEPDMEVDAMVQPVPTIKKTHFGSHQSGPATWLDSQCRQDPCSSSHAGSAQSLPPNKEKTGTLHRRSGGAGSFDESEISSHRKTAASSITVWGNPPAGNRVGDVGAGAWVSSSKPCSFFLRGHCSRGNLCGFLHSFSNTKDMSFMTTLHGHEKAIRSIVLPSGSNNMYTGSQDRTIRIWDCETGQCANVIQMGSDVGCLLTESDWLFVGLPNEVKALHLYSNAEQRLEGPMGQVHALVVFNDLLLAGAENGSILAWRFNTVLNVFQLAATLLGHMGGVVSLEAAEGRLYSGSTDFTIKVWDLMTGICMQTLQAHTNIVMGLLFWNQYLISGSLDGTVKVWAANQSGSFDLSYTHSNNAGVLEHPNGVLAFRGFVDHHNKDMLLCSLNDNSVRLLELPSFTERCAMFSKDEIRALLVTPSGLVIAGDNGGHIKVWKWAP